MGWHDETSRSWWRWSIPPFSTSWRIGYSLVVAKMSQIWIVYLEVRGTRRSALPASAGAFVECYTPAESADDAILLARQALEQDGYRVVGEVESITFEAEAWDDENDPDGQVRTAASAARREGCLQYGPFRAWER
jgi:hypothetical protein